MIDRKETVEKYYMSNRDLLIISILSGIGGVMSTYVGYLGNLLNRIFGVPFGAGQFVAGLHVFWIILVAGLVRRPGAATAAGLLKGIVELLTGSTHGVVIVIVCVVQGLLVDLVLLVLGKHNIYTYALAGALASASNVIVFQLFYFSGAPIAYIAFISALAFISGIIFAGCFGQGVLDMVIRSRPVRMGNLPEYNINKVARITKKKTRINSILTGILALAFTAGAVLYFAIIYEPPWKGPEFSIEGMIEKPAQHKYGDFSDHEVTIEAELVGQVSYVPLQNYTGIPVNIILETAKPLADASTLRVIATDGYQVDFELAGVLIDDEMILIEENDTLRLIAGNYEGAYWVKLVSKLVVW